METTSSDFKTHFGQFMEAARDEPVHISKSGKPSVVMLSVDEFNHLQALEDAYLGIQAEMVVARNDFISGPEAMQILTERLTSGA